VLRRDFAFGPVEPNAASDRRQAHPRFGEEFLKAGVLGEDQVERDTVTGTPQGGILTPPTQ